MTVTHSIFPSFLFWRVIEGYGVDIVLIAIPHGPAGQTMIELLPIFWIVSGDV